MKNPDSLEYARAIKRVGGKISHENFLLWVAGVGVGACVVLFTVFGLYFWWFSSGKLSASAADWGLFGDFVGGTSNPILAFLTLVALCLTIILQSKQLVASTEELELSRKELELTRQELSRSAKAQEDSERSLRTQAEAAHQSARLAATNLLLDHYKEDLKAFEGKAFSAQDPRLRKKEVLNNRISQLNKVLDSMFKGIVGDGDEKL